VRRRWAKAHPAFLAFPVAFARQSQYHLRFDAPGWGGWYVRRGSEPPGVRQ